MRPPVLNDYGRIPWPTKVSSDSTTSSTTLTAISVERAALEVAREQDQPRERGDQHPRVRRRVLARSAPGSMIPSVHTIAGHRQLATVEHSSTSSIAACITAPISPNTRLRSITGWLKWSGRDDRRHPLAASDERQQVGLLAPAVVLGDVGRHRVAGPRPQEQHEAADADAPTARRLDARRETRASASRDARARASAAEAQTGASTSPTGCTAVPNPAATPASHHLRRSSAQMQIAANGSSSPSE